MLAQATELTAKGGIDTAAVQSSRAAAFDRAQRHSRRVRRLKYALPTAAAFIALAFPIYSYMAAPSAVTVKTDDSALTDGKLVMANPKLEGVTKENLPYSMVARRAIQDVAQQGLVELEDIDARLPMSVDATAEVKAGGGSYDQENNTLELSDDIIVTTTDGMVAKLKSAFLDLGRGSMKTGDPVDITRTGSHIAADSMSVENNGNLLVFEKRVRVNLDPAALRAANGTNGAPDASR